MSRQASRQFSLPSSSSGSHASARYSEPAYPMRSLADVRNQVAQTIAMRALRKTEIVDGTKISVTFTLSKTDDASFLRSVAAHIKHTLALSHSFLFAVATPRASHTTAPAALLLCASHPTPLQKAAALASSKFAARLVSSSNEGTRFLALIQDLASVPSDEPALWDVLKKAAQRLVDPALPPPHSRPAALLLSDARARLERIPPSSAFAELADPATLMPTLLVDIRPERQRTSHGGVSGALCIDRTELEWAFDPRDPRRLEVANRYDLRVIVMDQDGEASSLAAAALQDLGLLNATDVVGGFRAWVEDGLPMAIQPSAFIRWDEED